MNETEHFVQFYETDTFLLDSLSGFIGVGLSAGDACIVIATPENRAGLEDPGFLEAFGPVPAHESLKRVPPGLPPDHPLADMFRFKDVVFGRRLSDVEIRSPDLPDILADGYAAAIPVFRFLSTLG